MLRDLVGRHGTQHTEVETHQKGPERGRKGPGDERAQGDKGVSTLQKWEPRI